MGTKNNPGEFDSYANAEPDEPMFVLLGRDKHAPTLVWLWAVLRELDEEDEEKVKEARECCYAMIDWAHSKGRPSVGLGQAAIAAVMELIRAVNACVMRSNKKARNQFTDVEVMRLFLAETSVEMREDAAP